MATKDLTPQLMKGEVWSVNGQRGAVTLLEPINSLDSDSTTAPLAAAQGKALKGIADGAVSTANEAKAGLDSKADKASNNFTTSLQLKGAGVATEAYVKTADVSGTNIDGKNIKDYIKSAGGGNMLALSSINTVGCIGEVYMLQNSPNEINIAAGGTFAPTNYWVSGEYGTAGSAVSGTWRAMVKVYAKKNNNNINSAHGLAQRIK